jgi:glycosyltransferase involved in cell wall biosynthesis
MNPLIVDDRWHGEHGIGRFASEVLSRLAPPTVALGGAISPTSAKDVVNPRRFRLKATDTIYSPGFNAGLTRGRQVLTLHDLIHLQIDSEKSLLKSLYYNVVVKWAARRAGLAFTVSETSADVIRTWLKSPGVEVVVVGCGRSAAFQRAGTRDILPHPTFVYVGNLKPHKNVEVLFDALALRPQYSLILVTSDAAEARRLADAAGVSSRVEIRSGVSDAQLASLYRGVTGVLQPSLLEGFGLPVLEAMSCGTRVAYWAGCESVSEITAGTGIAVDTATDATQWASAMDVLNAMIENGPLVMPTSWESLYDWDTVARKIEATLIARRY